MTQSRLLNTRWVATLKQVKLKDLHLHGLRREFASQPSEARVPIDQVRDALGHSNIGMTNQHFRIRKDTLKRAYAQRTAYRARKRMKAV